MAFRQLGWIGFIKLMKMQKKRTIKESFPIVEPTGKSEIICIKGRKKTKN